VGRFILFSIDAGFSAGHRADPSAVLSHTRLLTIRRALSLDQAQYAIRGSRGEALACAARPANGNGSRACGSQAEVQSYSQRSAFMGSMVVARRAGTYPASAVTAAIPSEAAAMVSRSLG
jgi:hypothetical protein